MLHKLLLAGAAPLALASCGGATVLPDATFLTEPASVTVAPRRTGYADPIRNYTARPVVEPADWRELNRSQERG